MTLYDYGYRNVYELGPNVKLQDSKLPFAGSLAAGLLGTLWTSIGHPEFFVLLAAICACAAVSLRLLDGYARQIAASAAATRTVESSDRATVDCRGS